MIEIALVVIVLVVFVGIVYALDRRTRTKGSLFTGAPTPATRVIALLLGLVFGGFFAVEFFMLEKVHCIFPILAIASLGYALGSTWLLRNLQGEREPDTPDEDAGQ